MNKKVANTSSDMIALMEANHEIRMHKQDIKEVLVDLAYTKGGEKKINHILDYTTEYIQKKIDMIIDCNDKILELKISTFKIVK